MDEFEYLGISAKEIAKEDYARAQHKASSKFVLRFLGKQKFKKVVLDKLNVLGAQGWELTGVVTETFLGCGDFQSSIYFLKRRCGSGKIEEDAGEQETTMPKTAT